MVTSSTSENSRNKSFIINNRQLLKEYAQNKQESLGLGIIVVNLLLLAALDIDESNLSTTDLASWSETTLHQPVSYIPKNNLWFKALGIKIKCKHQIDIQADSSELKTFVVFIKDTALENFSIYIINR
ncbi:MAG: hypothetical protein AAFQ41_01485 [Cyanobacteria bacterium J06623_7]